MKAKTVTTTVELPHDLRQKIKAIAQAEGRSFAGQVRFFLAYSVTRKNTAKKGATR